MPVTLVRSNKYNGRYVALSGPKGRKVISSSKSVEKVYASALKKGYKNPVVVYIPKKNEVHIY